jgi:hypothetical protein
MSKLTTITIPGTGQRDGERKAAYWCAAWGFFHGAAVAFSVDTPPHPLLSTKRVRVVALAMVAAGLVLLFAPAWVLEASP